MGFGANTPPAAAARPPQSKYGGIVAADTRDPMLEIGRYRVRVVSAAEGYNRGKNRESYKVSLYVVRAEEGSGTKRGALVVTISLLTPAGLGELKRFAMCAAGYGVTFAQLEKGVNVRDTRLAAEAAYDKLDEGFAHQGAILEATAGHVNGAPSLVGRLVDVDVTRGKDVMNAQTGAPTGDYYRNFTWGVVPDEEQEPAA